MSNLITISEASNLLGVSTKTLRRWESEGKIQSYRTEGRHRRYDVAQLLGNKNDGSFTIGYARVSSKDQEPDLLRQVQVLEFYCSQKGWSFEIISDYGSRSHKNKKIIEELKEVANNLK